MFVQCDLYKNQAANYSNVTLPLLVKESALVNQNVSEHIDYLSNYYKNKIAAEMLIQVAYNSKLNQCAWTFLNKYNYMVRFGNK